MKKHRCCSDKEVSYDVDDHKHFSKVVLSFQKVDDIAQTPAFYSRFEQLLSVVPEVLKVSHSPPLSGTELHILHCVFLI